MRVCIPWKCSIIGGTARDVEAKLGKARLTFKNMNKLRKSKIITKATKVKKVQCADSLTSCIVFKITNNVLSGMLNRTVSILLSESWTITAHSGHQTGCKFSSTNDYKEL